MEQKGSKTGASSHLAVTLHRNDVIEVKSLASPPQGVVNTLTAVLYLLGKPVTPGREWVDVRKFIGSLKAVEEMNKIDVSKVQPEAVAKAKEVLSGATYEDINNKAKSVVGIFLWVKAVFTAVESHSGATQ